MSVAAWAMIGIGLAVLAVGFICAGARVRVAHGAAKLIVLAPVLEAAALGVFATEHFFFAQSFMTIVPHWLPARLFLTYFVGIALLAAAISLVLWRLVHWSAPLVALLMLIFVAMIHLPNLLQHMHERLFWTLVFRELSFGAGALVLAGSLWPGVSTVGRMMMAAGRWILASALIFFGVQHFMFPHFAPGVPLQKMTPGWVPAPVLLAYFVGTVLLLCGVGLPFERTRRPSAVAAGLVLLLLTVFFYTPILILELRTPLVVEGINYVADTLLFAASVLLAGRGREIF